MTNTSTTSPASRMHVEYARHLADQDPAHLDQTYAGLIVYLIEQTPDADLAAAISRTLSPEIEPLVLIEATAVFPELVPDDAGLDLDAAIEEWDQSSRVDGPAMRQLVEVVAR